MLAAGLPQQGAELEVKDRVPRAMRGQDTLSDIFVMVKEYMASPGLSQPPRLAVPGALRSEAEKVLRDANSGGCPLVTCKLDPARRDELRLLRQAIQTDFPCLTRALSWYDTMLCQKPSQDVAVPDLSFLRRGTTQRTDWGAMAPPNRPLLPKPFELKVVFHRAR